MGSRWKTIAALWASLWPSAAFAQSAEGQEAGIGSVLKSVDQGFGANVVGPIAQVLFFDLIFWDNGTEGDRNSPLSSSG